MMDSVGPARGQADNRGGSYEAAPLIGSPCAAPIVARGAKATPRRGRRYECSLDPPSSVSPRHPAANPRASPYLREESRYARLLREGSPAMRRARSPASNHRLTRMSNALDGRTTTRGASIGSAVERNNREPPLSAPGRAPERSSR